MEISPDLPLAKLLDLMLDAVCVVGDQDRIVFVSAASEQVFGYRPEEMIGMNIFDLIHPDDRGMTFNESRKVISGNLQTHFENRYIRKDGSVVHIMWSAQWSEDHKLRIGVARDITKRKIAEMMREAVYAISEAANTAQDLPDLFKLIHHIVGELMPAKNFYVALYDAPGKTLSYPYFVDERQPVPASGELDSNSLDAKVIRNGKPLLVDTVRDSVSWLGVPLKSGQEVIGLLAVHSYSANIRYTEADMELLQFVSTQIATAIVRKIMQTRLEYMAQYDQLTGLPNRELFVDRLRVALTRAKRNKTLLALLFVDLENFKSVNDTLGHAAGDDLLQLVAGRLNKNVRAADTVARLGGDEFVVLLEGVSDEENAAFCVEKIRKAFVELFEIDRHKMAISPSIGVALYPAHGENEDQLLKYADQAMYEDKRKMAKGIGDG